MNRSEINAYITEAKELLDSISFKLPPFAYWTPEDWSAKGAEADEIRDNALGWDITDYAEGRYDEIGLLLEMLVRAYDPCISCSTHNLDVRFVEE